MSSNFDFTRRKFLKATTLMAGAVVLSGSVVGVPKAGAQSAKADVINADRAFRGYMFFTNSLQYQTISAAAERIFPKDKTGPGAIELGVPFFIDNQLASGYGNNAREYIMGPFTPGAPTQGQQTALLRKEVFIHAIRAINKHSESLYKKEFPSLNATQQDEILKQCEAGKIPMEGFTSSYFFGVLRLMVLAGVYADPIYNGNIDMQGWKMKKYPGSQMEYSDVFDSFKFDEIEPLSLADMF